MTDAGTSMTERAKGHREAGTRPTELSGRPIRVLLMSPMASRDPASGDIAYTDSLLSEPPPGVRYTTYAEAIAAGQLVVRGRRPRHRRLTASDAMILAFRALETSLRGRLLFREPIWFVTIKPGEFDLIHQHLFAVRQVGPRLPVVSSAGYPLSVLYQARERWTPKRVALAAACETWLARAVRVHTPGTWAPPRDVMTVYTEHFRRYLVAHGIAPERVLRCGQGLPELAIGADRPRWPTVGFIGRDFEMKGGNVAVDAFERLRAAWPSLRLLIVTRAGADAERLAQRPGVDVVTDATREDVLSSLLPAMDILLSPTLADCGAPFAILEALQAGVPVVTSTNPWLDDRLVGPAVRRVAPEADAVAEAAASLLDAAALGDARSAARDLWLRQFSMAEFHRQLLVAYDAARGSQIPFSVRAPGGHR